MLMDELNDKQRLAATTLQGPLLIIAGAGSGKTKAITVRMAYMIAQGVHPASILAVTFTNKAANEMRERLQAMLGPGGAMPHMGTFHSICVRILRREIQHLGYEPSFVIYDANDTLALIKRILKEKHINEKQYFPKAILGAISNAKNALITAEDYSRHVESNGFHQVVGEIYRAYQRALREASALDFDDIIMLTVLLYQQFPEILERYQEQFRYISVDEYQDTNHAQYKLISMLAAKYRNICVIGDDWQSIYSWRGANMENILSFERDYPDAVVIKLEQNYRSPKAIVEAANAVIAHNRQRSDKALWTERDNGEMIHIREAHNEREEAEHIADRIQELQRQGVQYSDMAILYRTNAQSRILEDCMLMRGLPYRIVGGVRFYERKEIKDMLAYLRCLQNPRDNVSFARIINVPTRKIGAKTVEALFAYATLHGISLMQAVLCYDDIPGLGRGQGAVGAFAEVLHALLSAKEEVSVSGLLKHVITLTRYQQFLQDGTDEGEERFANVAELVNVASKYDMLEPGVGLSTFLEEVALVSDLDSLSEENNTVTLMTLHSSKGLEYPYVFIGGLEEGIFPSGRSQMNPDDLEEERRIMYVGMTRAMERLFLSFAKTRMLYGEYQYNNPSRFLGEIPVQYVEQIGGAMADMPSLYGEEGMVHRSLMEGSDEPRLVMEESEEVEYSQGEKVRHGTWGMGTVIESYRDKVVIVFDNPLIGRKILLKAIAPLERIISYD